MVLSDRFSGGDPNPSLFKRTALYVLGFGLGALAIAAVLSFTLVSIAEGVLPDSGDKKVVDDPEAGIQIIGDPEPKSPRPGSKARPPRANEGAAAAKADGGPI
jgi:hypothetical protein